MAVSAARLAADSLRVLPRKRLSRALGQVADLQGPPVLVERAVQAFVRFYGVDMSEVEVPSGGFASFGEFFTRRLRPGARPIDPDPRAVVSPADGRLEALDRVDEQACLRIKGQRYRAGELIGDEREAARFEGGTFFVVYLHPRDYHRVHAAVSGPVTQFRYLGGTLFPVNALGTRYIERLFARNERITVLQKSEHHGDVALVMVGAIGVGRIGLSFDELETNAGRQPLLRQYGDQGPRLERGEELGVFNLGSTVIVFLGPELELELLKSPGDRVRLGEALVRKVDG